MPAVILDATTEGKTQAMMINASNQEYVKRMTIVPIMTETAFTNIATLVVSPS